MYTIFCYNYHYLLLSQFFFSQEDYKTAARLYKRATEIKETEASYTGKDFSRCSSGGDTNSTVKNSERTVG